MTLTAPETRGGDAASVAAASTAANEFPTTALRLLSGAAVALGSTAERETLLADLAGGVRKVLDADRVSILLIDARGLLVPAVAVARRGDEALWQRFRAMPPISIDAIPGAREAFMHGSSVVIEDARTSPLIPRQWQQAFNLSSLAIASLRADGEPLGILVVEHQPGSAPFTPEQVALIEGIAGLAAVAVPGVDTRSTLDRLVSGVVAVSNASSARAVAEHALAALLDLAGSDAGLVAVIDGDAFDVVSVRGMRRPEPGTYPLSLLPVDVLETGQASWTTDKRRAVVVAIGDRDFGLVPMWDGERLAAVAALATTGTSRFDSTALTLLAEVTAAGLRAVTASSDASWYDDAIRALAAVPDDAADETGVRRGIDRVAALLATRGLHVVDVVVTDRVAARATGLPRATGELAAVAGRWRHGVAPTAVAVGDNAAVAIGTGRDHCAVLLLVGHTSVDDITHDRAVRVAADVIRALITARVRAHAEDANRRAITLSDTRHDVAQRCYQEADQLLSRLLESQHDERRLDRTIVFQLRRLLQDSAEALSTTPGRAQGLKSALQTLAQREQARSGMTVTVQTSGRVPALAPATQIALVHGVRVLVAFVRATRAALCTIHVDGSPAQLRITVGCDGLLGATPADEPLDLHAPLRGARWWLAPIDATVEHSTHRGEPRFHVVLPVPSPQPGLQVSER